MPGHLIVAHLINGTVAKGTSLDVEPGKPLCHLRTEAGETLEIALKDAKALFFVKDATGRKEYQESKQPSPGDPRLLGTHKVRVLFADGEEIIGLMNRFPPIKPFFFMLPVDPESNNVRILVNREATRSITQITA